MCMGEKACIHWDEKKFSLTIFVSTSNVGVSLKVGYWQSTATF